LALRATRRTVSIIDSHGVRVGAGELVGQDAQLPQRAVVIVQRPGAS
jgi:hypothetical protein